MVIKGIAQIHSTYSGDSSLTLEEIKNSAMRNGMSFVLMTDHIENIDAATGAEFVEKCSAMSDGEFLFIPGFEVKSEDDYHFLCYHSNYLKTSILMASELVPDLRKKLDAQGMRSMLVLAHTKRYSRLPPRSILDQLDAVEVWNSKYDSQFAPSLDTIKNLRDYKGVMLGGVDAHNIYQLNKIWFELDIPELNADAVIEELGKKRAFIHNGYFRLNLNSDDCYRGGKVLLMRSLHGISMLRKPLKSISRNLPVPKTMRKMFHRFF